ncbi:MAG: winged helix-turn-helix domain-containing protein [Proteobacteria bacterium]|nr:winged helix-turn-helix domain-containing protein [Pseudomonadota bacterium]
MTFFEAAIEVLRWAQKPLDYKAITQFAINRNLLGHIGHTPDIIMASCLIRAVQRSETGALIRLPSGEFALRGWPEEILNKAAEQAIPEEASTVEFPPVHIGLLNETDAVPLLENDDIQFRKAVQLKFENEVFSSDDKADDEWEDSEHSRFEQLREELNAQHNEHFNLCAAIVKMLRRASTPMRSAAIANMLSQTCGSVVYEQSIVLAMRADNALRVSRGKRAIFMHILPDLWTLSENYLARHILRLESRLYDMSRQLRLYSIHALSIKLHELSPQAWLQLASIILKHLNYTIISQCETSESIFVFRAEESRGLTYIPVIIRVQHSQLVGTDDVIQFREIIRELGYDHGVLLTNGEVSRDALNECTTKDLPIYAYSARQIAPIMLDAKIGVVPNELPIVFIDNNFFHALSVQDEPQDGQDDEPADALLMEETGSLTDILQDTLDDEVSSGEFLFDTSFNEKDI